MSDIVSISLLEKFSNLNGSLTSVESFKETPFDIKRLFYIYDVDVGSKRGQHAHRESRQFLICLSGAVKIRCNDGSVDKYWTLNRPDIGVYIPNMIWSDQVYLKINTILLVLTDTEYNETDYIRDYNEFKTIKNNL